MLESSLNQLKNNLTLNSKEIVSSKENTRLINLLIKLNVITVIFKYHSIKGMVWLEASR